MANMYTLPELVRFGVQIEKNGRDFYDLASKNVKADRVRQVFEYISNDEQQHIAAVEGILDGMGADARPAGRFPAEYTEYLTALVDGNVFTKSKQGSEVARALRNDMQAVETGLGFEKDAILLYTEIRKLAGAGHEALDKLIAEEQDHFRRLAEVMKGFNKFGVGSNRLSY
jgi:rubrerythrin